MIVRHLGRTLGGRPCARPAGAGSSRRRLGQGAATVALLAALTAPVQAAFEIVGTGPQAPAAAAPVAAAPVAAAPAALPDEAAPASLAPAPVLDGDVVRGFGRDLPVEVVAAQVIPPEYTIAFAADVDRARVTSWSGERAWRAVLGDAIAPLGLEWVESPGEVLIRHAARAAAAPAIGTDAGPGDQVALAPAPAAGPGPDAPSAVAGALVPPADGANALAPPAGGAVAPSRDPLLSADPNGLPVTQVAAAPAAGGDATRGLYKESFGADFATGAAPVPVGAGEWVAVSGSTLKRTLTDWAITAGWTVAWQSNLDYRLEAGAVFEGDFIRAGGNLLRTFARAEPPVRATFYTGNRVVVVDTGLDNVR